MKKIKSNLSDIMLFSGLLSLGYGVYVEYSIGSSFIICGILVLLMGYRLIPKKG